MEKIGTLKHLRRYPVKGMKGEDLGHARVTQSGVEGDRVYAFVDQRSESKNFPWMTARQKHEMILFTPRLIAGGSVKEIEVFTPDGDRFVLPGGELLEHLKKAFSYELSLEFEESGMKDSRPLSLISLQSIRALGGELGMNFLHHERFRANFYADWHNQRPYFENELVGNSLKIGDAEITIDKRNSRCVVPTLDPLNASSSPEILERIKQAHQGCIGVYALAKQEGRVSAGDSIYLL